MIPMTACDPKRKMVRPIVASPSCQAAAMIVIQMLSELICPSTMFAQSSPESKTSSDSSYIMVTLHCAQIESLWQAMIKSESIKSDRYVAIF
jgi:hypothetical protein